MRPPDTERRLPGQELGWIGGWRLTGVLGRGNMGVVYAAEREGFPRAALKVLHDVQAREGEDQRFAREVEALRRIEHAAIVRVLDAGRERGRAYLATELCEGETLDRVLVKSGKLSPWAAGKLALDLASALDHAHRHGVIHRDVKPSNVIVEPATGRARLFDFGVARLEDAGGLTRTGEILGTPLYMAPEQILGERVDQRVDLWALGVVLFECLCGERPFSGRDLPEVCANLLDAPLPSLRGKDPAIPAALEQVVRRALTRERDRRYQDAAEMARDLRAFLSPTGSASGRGPLLDAAPAPGPATLAPPRSARSSAASLPAAAWVAALVLALGAGLAAALLLRGRAREGGTTDPAPPADAAPPAPSPLVPSAPEGARALLARARERARASAPAGEVLPLLERALESARAGEPGLVPELLFARADLLRRRGRFADAVAATSELAGQDSPWAREAALVRALSLLRLGRDEEGLGALEALHLADPQGASGLVARAIHGVFTGGPRALEDAEAALALEPGHAQALTTRGWALLNAGRLPEAVTALRAQREAQPDDPRVLYGLGSALHQVGEDQAALAALDEARALLEPPGFWRFQLARLEVLAALGRERERLEELDRYLVLRPEDGEALLVRGALRTIDRRPGGAEDWRRAAEVLGPARYRELVVRYLGETPLARQALGAGLR